LEDFSQVKIGFIENCYFFADSFGQQVINKYILDNFMNLL